MDTTDKSNEGQEKTKEMTIEKYNNYAKGMDANQEVQTWVSTNLYNHLKKSEENQNEIEHIIDYLVSDKAPKRLKKMSYAQAKSNTDKWNKALIKKGAKINESEKDIEIVLELDNGFKWVKLVGENAFKREGALMRHCVSSYYGKDVDIYSLRDKKNEPHCTVEKDQQIKGKGNGNIHPKYISYVVSFLEWTGMEVSDNEMLNLGYINISDFKEDLSEECIKQSYKEVYLPKDFKFKDKEGSDFWSLDIMDKVPLLDLNLDIAIPLELIGKGCSYLLNKIFKAVKKDSGDYTQNASSGYNTKNASSGYNTQNASSGDYTQNASSGDYTQNASSGDYTKNASSGDYTQNASSGYNTQNASSGYNTQNASSGDYTQNASSGDYTQNASSGYNTKNASSGYNTQNASSGYNTQNASSGDYTQNASSGDYTKNASSGDYTKNASSGDYTKNASSGDYTKNASSGDYTKNASSGDYTKNASSGDYTKNASSGDYTTHDVKGEKCVVVAIGRNSKIKASKGTWITLAEYDGSYEIKLVRSAQIDGEELKENVWYQLINGEFTEVKI